MMFAKVWPESNRFATSREARLREQYEAQLQELLEAVHMGVPMWLGRPFALSPLQEL